MEIILAAAAMTQLLIASANPTEAQQADGVVVHQTSQGNVLTVTGDDGTQFVIDIASRKQYILFSNGKRSERRF
jgi:hypothetical protein